MNNLVLEQNEPQPNGTRPVWEMVMEDFERLTPSDSVTDSVLDDMRDRNEEGRRKYGTPLQCFNGRNALVDLYQELLDAAVYTRQELEENEQEERSLVDYDQLSEVYVRIMQSLTDVRALIARDWRTT
jgi:hypothetical protein